MQQLELTRSDDSRRSYEIAGIGTLRFDGRFSHRASAESGANHWSFGRRGTWQTTIEALDATGTVVGSFSARKMGRGSPVRWDGADYELRSASWWRKRYVLAGVGGEIATLTAGGRSRRPVSIGIEEPGSVDPGLLLFLAYAVREMTGDAGAATAAASVAATGA